MADIDELQYCLNFDDINLFGADGNVIPEKLTISFAQRFQPWTVPYSKEVESASLYAIPHVLGSHCALHAAKSVGKLASVFEALDHRKSNSPCGWGFTDDQLQTIKAMSADLVTAALRFANLCKFDLATELVRRVKEKNGVTFLPQR